MKKLTYILAVGLITASCSNAPQGEAIEATDAVETTEVAEAVKYGVFADESTIFWEGSDVVGEIHYGSISLAEGSLYLVDGELVGGNFVIDMSSIVDSDLDNPKYNAKLVGHLMSDDFFGVDSFPTATFEITNVSALEGDSTGLTHKIAGNLTMRGISKNIEFRAGIRSKDGFVKAVSESFVIDRSNWNVKFRSPSFFSMEELKDKAINDNIKLQITIIAAENQAVAETATEEETEA